MRISPLFLICVALSLAASIGVGCSTRNVDESSSVGTGGFGSGGAPFFSTGDDPPFPDVGVGPMPLPEGIWLNHYGEAEDQTAAAMAANEAGEIALVGTAKGTIDFGNIPWKGTTTDTDVVVAKISSKGQSLWSRRYGDSCDQRGGAVAHTPSGNVLLAGDFCGKMDFGTTTVETKGAEVDLFVAVIDTLGEDVYSRRFGGKGAQIARAAAVGSKGNAVIVGSFDQAFDDGSGEVATAGLDDIFVLELDPGGKVLWSQRFGGPESDIPRAVAIDATGNILLGGSFGGSVDFGGGPITAPPGHPSAFLIQLDAAGKLLWSQTFASDDAVVNSVALGENGLIGVAGSFAGSLDLGDGTITTAGKDDAFVAKIDSTGKLVWGRAFGGPGSTRGVGVAFGVNGALAFTGTSDEALDFGGFGIGTIAPNAPDMVFVAEFDSSSVVSTGWALGSGAPMQSVGVAFSGKLEVTVAGSFQAPFGTDFGIVQPEGGWDMFLVHRL